MTVVKWLAFVFSVAGAGCGPKGSTSGGGSGSEGTGTGSGSQDDVGTTADTASTDNATSETGSGGEAPPTNDLPPCKEVPDPAKTPAFEEVILTSGTDLITTGAVPGWIDGNGRADIVVSSTMSAGGDVGSETLMTVLRGDGQGGFAAPLGPFVVGGGDRPPVLADIDGDGLQDVVHGHFYALATAGGELQEAIEFGWSVRIADDLDANDLVDLISFDGEDVGVRLGLGGGEFGDPIVSQFDGSLSSSAVGDIDGDGRADVLGIEYYPPWGDPPTPTPLHALLGDGVGGLTAEPAVDLGSDVVHMAGGDFNCDGRLDVATAGHEGTVEVRLRDEEGWVPPMALPGDSPAWVAVGDVNGDGAHDLVVANAAWELGEGYVSVFLGDGSGEFAGDPIVLESSLSSDYPNFVDVCDVTGDGLEDVVTTFSGPDEVSVWIASTE